MGAGLSRRFAALAAVLGLVGAFAGCGGDSGDDDAAPAEGNGETTGGAAEEPVSGGSLTWLTLTEPNSLDAGLGRGSTAIDANPFIAIYDQLVIVEPDGTIVPRLATEVETDDAVVWTITLREGVTFSDGTPLDAEAVKFNWDRIADPTTASPSAGVRAAMTSIEVIDAHTLRVTLDSPNSQWPRSLMRGLGFIGSPKAITELGEGFGQAPVGAGPFTFGEWVSQDHLTLVRNPSYWDAPKPYLDEVVFRVIPDVQQRADTFMAGGGDIVWFPGPTPQVTQIADAGYEVFEPELSGGLGMAFNVERPPFDDRRMRLAMVHATDLQDFNVKAFGGGAVPVDTFFPESSPFYDPDLVQPTNDLSAAQELVDEWVADNGGPVQIAITTSNTNAIVAEVLQQQWQRLDNVEVSVESLAGTEALRRQLAGEFQVVQSAITGIDPEPNVFERLYSDSPLNFGSFADPDVDEAILLGRSAFSTDERRSAYTELQEVLLEEVPYVFTVRSDWPTAVGNELEGVTLADDGLANFAEIWRDGG